MSDDFRTPLVLLVIASALALIAQACGASASAGTQAGGSAGSGAVAAGGSGFGGKSGNGGKAGTGGSGATLTFDAGSQGDAAELDPDAACAAETFDAEPAPLNLMVMLDRSCSMSEPSSDPLWDRTKAGLEAFFSSPALDGVGVALHYFPTPDTDMLTYCQGDEATPTVPLGKLGAAPAPADVQEQKLFDSMDAQTFNFGGTPMFQALYGALSYASVFATQTPEEQIVAILVTDGVPGESCDYNLNNNIPKIAALAKFAYEANPSIRTFAIGLAGSQESEITTIAQAGGGEAFFLGGSTNVQQDLVNKLDSIKQSNLGCTFKIPEPKPGKTADPGKVNVKLEPGSGAPVPFFKVAGKSACVPNGWYYDDELHPSKILLCPGACQSVKNAPSGKVDVLIGCATELPK